MGDWFAENAPKSQPAQDWFAANAPAEAAPKKLGIQDIIALAKANQAKQAGALDAYQKKGARSKISEALGEGVLGLAGGGGLPETQHASDFGIIPGLKQIITHPINSAGLVGGAILDSHVDQFSKAKQALDAGSPTTAAIHVAGGLVPLVGPAAVGSGEEIGKGIQSGDVGQGAHGAGSALGLLLSMGLGTKKGQTLTASAVDNTVGRVTSAAGDAVNAAKSKIVTPLPELTSTTPERIAELKTFPQKMEAVRQSVVSAEKQAKSRAGAQFPKFDQPIEVGKIKEDVPVTRKGPAGEDVPVTTTDAEGKQVPVTRTVEKPRTATWNELQEQRSNLLKSIADEKRAVNRGAAPRFDLAEKLGDLSKLDAVMEDAALKQGGQAGLDQLKAARQAYKKYMDDFHNPGSPLRGIVEAKPGEVNKLLNHLLNPDKGARALQTLREYGFNTSEIEGMLGQGAKPLKVTANESAKLSKAGSDAAYTRQRLVESLRQATVNELPTGAEARLPASAMKRSSQLPGVLKEFPLADALTSPRNWTRWRLQNELNPSGILGRVSAVAGTPVPTSGMDALVRAIASESNRHASSRKR
jgi:hypothetical protein